MTYIHQSGGPSQLNPTSAAGCAQAPEPHHPSAAEDSEAGTAMKPEQPLRSILSRRSGAEQSTAQLSTATNSAAGRIQALSWSSIALTGPVDAGAGVSSRNSRSRSRAISRRLRVQDFQPRHCEDGTPWPNKTVASTLAQALRSWMSRSGFGRPASAVAVAADPESPCSSSSRRINPRKTCDRFPPVC